jgi:hypothetical protein
VHRKTVVEGNQPATKGQSRIVRRGLGQVHEAGWGGKSVLLLGNEIPCGEGEWRLVAWVFTCGGVFVLLQQLLSGLQVNDSPQSTACIPAFLLLCSRLLQSCVYNKASCAYYVNRQFVCLLLTGGRVGFGRM